MANGGVNISNKFLMLSFSSSLFKERCSNEANVSHVKAYYSIRESYTDGLKIKIHIKFMTIQSSTFNHISYSFATLYILPGPKMSNLNFFFFTSLHEVMLKSADLCVSAEGPVEVSVGFEFRPV